MPREKLTLTHLKDALPSPLQEVAVPKNALTSDAPPSPRRKKYFLTAAHVEKKQILQWLCDTFPLCFSLASPKPLQKKILHDFEEILPYHPPFSKTKFRHALGLYVNRKVYLAALIAQDKRVNLQGQEIQAVAIT